MGIKAQLYADNLGFPLGGSHDLMENAYGFDEFSFNLQQKQQQQQQMQYLQQKNQTFCFENTSFVMKNNHQEQSIVYQLEKQRQEIDRFISLQSEKFRLVLQEQRKQQITLLLKKYESKIQFLIGQKDEEIAKSMNRNHQLEEFLNRMQIENQTWQRLAKENEAMVIYLNNTIEQLKETAYFSPNEIEDAESCRGENMIDENREDKTRENRGNEEQSGIKMICKSCNSRNSCVVFLPCRHLCSCKACEVFLDSCPVCRIVKKASIEALI